MAKKKDPDQPAKPAKPAKGAKPKSTAAEPAGDPPKKKESLAGRIRATVRKVMKPSGTGEAPAKPAEEAPKKSKKESAEPAPKKGAAAPAAKKPAEPKAKPAPATARPERRAAPVLEDAPTVRMSPEEAREAAERLAKLPTKTPTPVAAPEAKAPMIAVAQPGEMGPASAKFEIEPPKSASAEGTYPAKPRDLPTHYDVTRVVLLPKDPEWAFAYWEISKADQDRLGLSGESQTEWLALRIHDASGGGEVAPHFDVKVGQASGSWHVRLPRAGRAWRAELGLAGASGKFEAICASGAIGATRDVAAAWGEVERWGSLERGALEEIFRLSGGEAPPPTAQRVGGSEALVARPGGEAGGAAKVGGVPGGVAMQIPKIGSSELTSRMR